MFFYQRDMYFRATSHGLEWRTAHSQSASRLSLASNFVLFHVIVAVVFGSLVQMGVSALADVHFTCVVFFRFLIMK